jgi:hypothetical protein
MLNGTCDCIAVADALFSEMAADGALLHPRSVVPIELISPSRAFGSSTSRVDSVHLGSGSRHYGIVLCATRANGAG